MEKTLVIVESPFQLLSAYEYASRYNSSIYDIVIVETGSKNNTQQMQETLAILGGDFYQSVSIIKRSCFFIFSILFKAIKSSKMNYKKILIGDYRSNYIRIIESRVNANTVVLDDGIALISSIHDIVEKNKSLISDTMISKLLSVLIRDVTRKRYSVFSMIPKNILLRAHSTTVDSYVNNDFSRIKELFSKKNDTRREHEVSKVCIIGSPLSDLNYLSEDVYIAALEQFIRFHDCMGNVLYIPHRRENPSKLDRISNELQVEVKLLSNPIEISVLQGEIYAETYISITSAALYSLSKMLQDKNFYHVYLNECYYSPNINVDVFEKAYDLLGTSTSRFVYE
ncbi:hypothetical protein KCN56_03130 [Photobacterium galatheae]|uniref:polysialyltransferase family glycosyltransferase n=1 Tax=Photobacterium galatheae TaxID=1654360 RepID=UPI00202CB1D2|nr:polysialyltransferase family glycosyltransferase [Photobacterium galatheae]MCM0147564.1 hypothetical protein [Photobacterium galatheae]